MPNIEFVRDSIDIDHNIILRAHVDYKYYVATVVSDPNWNLKGIYSLSNLGVTKRDISDEFNKIKTHSKVVHNSQEDLVIMGNSASRVSQSETTPPTAIPARIASVPSQATRRPHTVYKKRRSSTGVLVTNDTLTEQVLAWSASCKRCTEQVYETSDDNYLCPLTFQVPRVPVLLNGRVYELDFIAEYIKKGHKDPFSEAPAYLIQIQPYLNFFDLLALRLAADNPPQTMRASISP